MTLSIFCVAGCSFVMGVSIGSISDDHTIGLMRTAASPAPSSSMLPQSTAFSSANSTVLWPICPSWPPCMRFVMRQGSSSKLATSVITRHSTVLRMHSASGASDSKKCWMGVLSLCRDSNISARPSQRTSWRARSSPSSPDSSTSSSKRSCCTFANLSRRFDESRMYFTTELARWTISRSCGFRQVLAFSVLPSEPLTPRPQCTDVLRRWAEQS
mmetsp:Transcript_24307/g.62672  ORF Transcript_24307/g.62672 Transcript_24307/m.62672 type:complete len:214 (-) Transcript_24307:356-997(-)